MKKHLPRQKKLPLLYGIHRIARSVMLRSGYQWELRRNGELMLGLWRKPVGSKKRGKNSKGKHFAKRFVLIPGFGDTSMSWMAVLAMIYPFLARKYDEIVLVDFPGYAGFLSRERSFHSMDLLVSALGDALDSLKPHTVFGHSLGGWLATHYGSQCGESTRPKKAPDYQGAPNYSGPEKIIVANPSGLFESDEVKLAFQEKFKSAKEKGFDAIRSDLFVREPVWFKAILPEFSGFMSREDILQFLFSVREDHLLKPEKLARIPGEVWVLWGEKDTLVPSKSVSTWLKHLNSGDSAHAKAVLIRGAGHSPHIEKPLVTAAVLTQILLGREPKVPENPFGNRWWDLIGS